jgi:3-hydroxybutyryl-CoA dehydratase
MVADDSVFPPQIGQTASYSRFVSDADVALFALVTGDEHPLHLDVSYAAATHFARRIVPTMLLNGIIEAACAKTIPGIRGIFSSQALTFPAPAYIDDEITVAITVTSVTHDARQMVCQVVANRSDGTIAVSGETNFAIEDLPPFVAGDE